MKTSKLSDSDRFIPTRRSLLSRLKDWNDQESWREFFETYWTLIYKSAIRAGLTPAEAEDVVQETVVSVCKSLPGFNYNETKGGFKGWLMRLTTWRILDQIRRRSPAAAPLDEDPNGSYLEGVPVEQMAQLIGEPFETLWDKEWEANIMDAAMRRIKNRVDPKQLQIFDLLVRKNWPVGKVAEDLKINVARVYMARHRVGRLVKKEVEHLMTQPI